MMDEEYGRYSLIERVGQGGMSVVYRAKDAVLDREVALKLMHPHLAQRADSRARFSREAKAVARLRHRNIVEIFDYAPPESDKAYIVTEFIDGPTLGAFMDATSIWMPEAALLLFIPIAEALEAAHAKGIIHRDVKPENIMIRSNGEPVLMDFGIAQMVDMETLTATGTMLGSPAHMAPEVIDGHDVGAPADVFSLGTTLYWLICGALPFSGPNPSALFRRILETRYDPVLHRRPSTNRKLARLVESCLAREPSERPTCAELVEGMRGLLHEVELVDLPVERRAFWADPAVYQDQLKQRILPALMTMATKAYQEHRVAVAIGHIDRILGLNEGDEEAIALLDQIERGQRAGSRLRMALVAAGVLVAGLLLSQFWPQDDTPVPAPVAHLSPTEVAPPPVEPTPEPAAPLSSGEAPLKAPPATAVASFTSNPPPSTDSQETPPTTPDVGTAAPAREEIKKPSPRPKTSDRRRRPRPARSGAKAPTSPSPSPPPTPQIETRAKLAVHGKHKGAEVFVNGNRHPLRYLFKLENVGGIELGEGVHTVAFRNPGCREDVHRVQIAAGQKKAPPIAFKCVHLPATLRVDSVPGLAVRLRGARSGTLLGLGKTNQDISVTMDAEKIQVGLILGDPDDVKSRRDVTLIAGKRKVVRVKL